MFQSFQKIIYALFLVFTIQRIAAQNILPVGYSPEELEMLKGKSWLEVESPGKAFTSPPPGPVRNMAQWEETQALTVTWTSYPTVLREIVRAARKETRVYIICGPTCTGSSDSSTVKTYLTSGGVPLSNISFIHAPCNSVWTRDYSANPCYLNDVDSLVLVDWKYNRATRTKDDTIPRSLARALDLEIYETILSPNQLIHTGGNYMTDGMGTGFSSELILDENPTKTEAQIDAIMQSYMGITRYIKMATLPFDGIHHIDMHMKLLNEETLLVGEYPPGEADGPQIEANLAYVLSTFNSSFGTPYKVIRIPQPPDQLNGYTYPDNGGNYLTYTNATIINKSVIVPQFYTQYDTTAIRIWKDAMPGYNVVGINSNSTISASGSLHCITHAVGVNDPLLIIHQTLNNTTNSTSPYQVDARIQHRSGISAATLYYSIDTAMGFSSVAMSLTSALNNTWTGFIPPYPAGSRVHYYIEAASNSGKIQKRPMPAPAGTFEFNVLMPTDINEIKSSILKLAYPNPSHGLTCIPVHLSEQGVGRVRILDMLGKEVLLVYDGSMPAGEKNYFINSLLINPGAYLISLETADGNFIQKLMVK